MLPGSTHRGCILNVTLTGGFWSVWQPPQNYETTTVSQARNGMLLSKPFTQLYTQSPRASGMLGRSAYENRVISFEGQKNVKISLNLSNPQMD